MRRGFSLLRAQEWAGSLALAAGFCACAVSGELGVALTLLFPLALAGAALFRERAGGKYQWAWTAFLALALAVQGAQVLTARLDIVLAAAQFAVLLAFHRLWHRGTRRDELLLLLLSLVLLCAGAALSAELLFGLCFVSYSVVGTWALALTYLRFEIEAARSPEQSAALLHSGRLATPGLLAALALLALAGLAGSAAIFVAFPRVAIGGFRRASSSVPIAGLGDQIDLRRHGVIADDPRVVLRVRLDPSPPPGADLTMHWRARALEVWTGRGWRSRGEKWAGGRMAPLPPLRAAAVRAGRRSALAAEIEAVSGFSDGVVLTPEGWPANVSFDRPVTARGKPYRVLRSASGDLFYAPVELGDLRYEVTVERGMPGWPELRGNGQRYPADLDVDLEVPGEVDARVRQLSARLTKGKDPVEAASAIERWLSTSLGYTRELAGDRPDPIAHFLFESRQGHCELFSSAMVILLRLAGIPARNVTGYYGGTYSSAGYWAVRAGDAHSWVEVYVPGAGFVPFDPTPPGGRGGRQGGLWAALVLVWDAAAQRWRSAVVDYDLLSQQRTLQRMAQIAKEAGRRLSGAGPASSGFETLALRAAATAAAALVAVTLLRRRSRSGFRGAPRLEPDQRRARLLWRRARERLQKAGIAVSEAVPPREAVRRAAQCKPGAAATLEDLAAAVLRARWGGEPLQGSRARALLRDLRRQLR